MTRHSRIAFSSIASNTGARLPGEELMTCGIGGRTARSRSDNRLGVEVLQQRNLLVGELPHPLVIDRQPAKQSIVFTQRDNEIAADASEIHERATVGFSLRQASRLLMPHWDR